MDKLKIGETPYDRMFTASEVMMLMLDCGTTAAQLFGEMPGFRMQAEFILSSNDENSAKRLAFHALLLNVASDIINNFVKKQEKANEQKDEEPTDQTEQDGDEDDK